MISHSSFAENHDDIKNYVRRKCDGDTGYATLFLKVFFEEGPIYEKCIKHTAEFMNSTKRHGRNNYDRVVDRLRE